MSKPTQTTILEAEPADAAPVLRVESAPVGSLHLDPANARRHPERNLDAIKASLARFGQQKPLVVDADGIVRAGNGTLEAARALGWETIAVVRTPLRGSEATAYAISDNRTSELATWDETALAETLRALQSEDFDLSSVGYRDDEVDALIGQLADAAGGLAFVADPDEGGIGGGWGESDGDEDGVSPPESHVRMVQLFLTVETFPEFQRIVTGLAQSYGTGNTTDTVMECLRRAHSG